MINFRWFKSSEDAVAYYKVAIRKEREALDNEITRRLKRIDELEQTLQHNEKQLKSKTEEGN